MDFTIELCVEDNSNINPEDMQIISALNKVQIRSLLYCDTITVNNKKIEIINKDLSLDNDKFTIMIGSYI